ncbi:hypothetical protein [Pseudomonas sp. 11/12A]|uniref:hypothetical protein n=1 Tax=Pseudomonas sp. 11/12A TaxID=1506582 RepID=UPI001269E07F|nr:hypothetical protein [Pseudomonas sp. 11/12A]
MTAQFRALPWQKRSDAIRQACGEPVVSNRSEPEGRIQSLVAEFGIGFEPQNLPTQYAEASSGECYLNAFKLALSNQCLTYVEGYAIPSDKFGITQHAWCVGSDEKIIDPTWRDSAGCTYFGIGFKTEALRKAKGFPIITEDTQPSWIKHNAKPGLHYADSQKRRPL